MNDTAISNTDFGNGSNAGHGNENDRHSLQTYVSDLLALEEHIGKPLDAQVASEDVARYSDALAAVQTIRSQNKAHVEALRDCLQRLGGHEASPVKSAWSSLLGGFAAAIGASRKTKVTKWLRDDFTALNLANISYTLLHATSVGLGDDGVATIARQGLTDYARSVMQINDAIPAVVLAELQDDGENVSVGAAETIRRETQEIWKSQSPASR